MWCLQTVGVDHPSVWWLACHMLHARLECFCGTDMVWMHMHMLLLRQAAGELLQQFVNL